MRFVHKIKFKFTIWYLAVLCALLLLLSAGIYFNVSRTLNADLNNTLRARAEQLIALRDVAGIIESGQFEENVGELVSIYFHSRTGQVRASTRSGAVPADGELIDSVIGGKAFFMTVRSEGGRMLRVFATPYRHRPEQPRRERPPPRDPDRPPPPPRTDEPGREMERPDDRRPGPPLEHPAAIFVGRDMEYINQALDALLRTLMFAVPLTLIIAGGGGVFLAGRVLKPVDRITNVARQIQESDLSRRIDVSAKDELGRLASTINQMIERLEKAFKRQKQFTGDASHELRAPLAVIEAESTLALERERSADEYRRSLANVAQEVKHMASIIDQLLKMARADAGKETFNFENVRLDELLETVTAKARTRCEEKGITLTSKLAEGLMLKGDPAMLKLLFTNLIENAIRYTGGGGNITVWLAKEEEHAVVDVVDTGIGIPASDLPRIFDRFYRTDKARSRSEGGSGLGLAICKQIAEIHGGSISVESEPGRGSTFTVRLH